ncbi:hypothetical protein N7478_012430 [Penicillium angulare]|uniref:uncharacterized protein n=1 Tax=Penicillium angulare TaxID=116970 RepID=UPI00253F7F55|nr:uncharacterized protein N7478_012430 [Penicillium angulare]KAJ5259449.1 hypothetical protein N7478_012430 [Penicillium angulare]
MTTASSLLHSAMDIPAGEDLEMASPYQGQTDDFDIDIDLMEDHASNMDSDMMGADDFPNTSQPSLFQNEATDDDDMVDEPSEGSMVDVEDLPDGDNDIDVHFEEVTYEADMLEGGHEEPVDAILPTIFIEASTTAEPQINEPTQIAPETTELIEKEQDAHGVAPPSIALEVEKQEPADQQQTISLEASKVDVGLTEEVQPPEIPQPSVDHDQNKEATEQTNEVIENENVVSEEHDHSNQLVGNLEAPPSPPAQAEALSAEPHAPCEPEPQGTHEGVHEDETLHPVKVIYQENEISLFPPLEGDSAETFFLHDEDTAYDNFDKLFESLRDVLLDNIAENDVLVIDIDSLGIQITEDSSYTSRFTLHQIMEIYLRLCHNDGNHHPDALYLSLSSKQAVHTELASLDSAAKEGKGLSQIQLWADYDDAEEEPAAEETKNDHEESGEGLHSRAAQQSQSVHEEAATSGEVPDGTNRSNEAANLTAEATQQPIVEHHAEPDEAQHEPNTTEVHESFQEIPHDDVAYTEVRDDDEDPRTASTNTVAPDSEPDAINAQPEDKSSTDILHDASEEHTTHHANQEHEHDELDDSDEISGADELEVVDFTIHEDEYDDQNEGGHVDYDHEDASSNQEAAEEEAHDDTDASEDNLESNLYEESESTLENAPHQDPSHQQTPEPEDHLLGIADDVLQTPPKDLRHDDSGNFEGFENTEDELVGPDFEDGADHQQSADDDYHHDSELDVTEELELGEIDPSSTESHKHDNLSVKRSREEEDEWDITESTTPDIKRRRPS